MTHADYFMATPAEGKECSFSHLERLATDLLQGGWVRLPARIFVGGVAYGPRYTPRVPYEDLDEDPFWQGFTAFYKLVAPNFIVPNAPEAMTGADHAPGLIWYEGADEHAYLETLHRVPFGEHNVCLGFPNLSPHLQPRRQGGVAIYLLTRPALIDFVEPQGYDAARLIHRGVTLFFTLVGHFSDLANNPLKPVLERAFGTDLEMAQTPDTYYQWRRDVRSRGENA